jgi:hypothetical protein
MEQIEYARELIAANQQALQQGHGAFELRGGMVDPPVVARAEEILRRAVAVTRPPRLTPSPKFCQGGVKSPSQNLPLHEGKRDSIPRLTESFYPVQKVAQSEQNQSAGRKPRVGRTRSLFNDNALLRGRNTFFALGPSWSHRSPTVRRVPRSRDRPGLLDHARRGHSRRV